MAKVIETYKVKVNCSNCELENQEIEIVKGTKKSDGIESTKCPNCGCKDLTLKEVIKTKLETVERIIYKDWYRNPFEVKSSWGSGLTCNSLSGQMDGRAYASGGLELLTRN